MRPEFKHLANDWKSDSEGTLGLRDSIFEKILDVGNYSIKRRRLNDFFGTPIAIYRSKENKETYFYTLQGTRSKRDTSYANRGNLFSLKRINYANNTYYIDSDYTRNAIYAIRLTKSGNIHLNQNNYFFLLGDGISSIYFWNDDSTLKTIATGDPYVY